MYLISILIASGVLLWVLWAKGNEDDDDGNIWN